MNVCFHAVRQSPTTPVGRLCNVRSNILRILVALVCFELAFWSFYSKRSVISNNEDFIQPFESLIFNASNAKQASPSADSPEVPSRKALINDSENYMAYLEYVSPHSSNRDFASLVHCVGDNWEPNSHLFRSCQFQNLCWIQQRQEFLLFPSKTQQALDHHLSQVWKHPYARVSTVMKTISTTTTIHNHTYSFSPLQVLPTGQRADLKNRTWFPTIVDDVDEKRNLLANGLWRWTNDVVVIPLYLPPTSTSTSLRKLNTKSRRVQTTSTKSLTAPTSSLHQNPDEYKPPSTWSLLTETLFPMYTLLSMFQTNQTILNLTIVVQFLPPDSKDRCIQNSSSSSLTCSTVLPDYVWWRNVLQEILSWHALESSSVKTPKPDSLICANHGVAGMGSLTDHGLHNGHGERGHDYRFPPQVGRGAQWWNFRNYILRQQVKKQKEMISPKSSFQTVLAFPTSLPHGERIAGAIQQHFDQYSSARHDKSTNDGIMNVSLVRLHFETGIMSGKNFFRNMTKTMRLAPQSNIFIAAADDFDQNDDCDDAESSIWPALFLPRGATLILYFDESRTVPIAQGVSRPRMMHFNVWNNLSYLKVHWLPLPRASSKKEYIDIKVLLSLIDIEMQQLLAERMTTKVVPLGPPAGKLNGISLSLKTSLVLPPSKVHCLGDNFHPWFSQIYQSCHIQNLCLDLRKPHNSSFFMTPPDAHHQKLADQLSQLNAPDARISTDTLVYRKRVTVGQIARFSKGSDWFPEVQYGSSSFRDETNDSNVLYYELPSNVIWLPFHAEQPNINNPGHLLWDFFLAMYTLMDMFDLEDHQLFLTNLDLKCSLESPTPCFNSTTKFLPMLGVQPTSFRDVSNMHLEAGNGTKLKSYIVCAPQGVVGMGMLTDHGLKRHGQGVKDYRHVHNVGRGAQLLKFRNHVLHHMGLLDPSAPSARKTKPFHAVFSINSSSNPSRCRDFTKQLGVVRSSFPEELRVRELVLARLSLKEQLGLMIETSVFVSVVGGASSTATFLSRGSCLILYFNDIDDFVSRAGEDRPSMMDWDFWNNASYMRVHWLPIKSMDDEPDLEAFRLLLNHEINLLSGQTR